MFPRPKIAYLGNRFFELIILGTTRTRSGMVGDAAKWWIDIEGNY